MEKVKVSRIIVSTAFLISFFLLLPLVGEAQAVNCPVESLQAAIDAATGPTTILVSGACNENVTIREDKDRIILDGQGTATINGPVTTSATIQVRGRGITIRNFASISGGQNGIQVWRRGAADIENNTIQSTGENGILVNMHSFARITNNTIQNNGNDGIQVSENSSARIGFLIFDDTVAAPNMIQNNGRRGITVARSSNAVIIGNTIINNVADGVGVVRVSQADISKNIINNNGGNAVLVFQNSGVNLGNDTGTTIFDLPNDTTVNNTGFGIRAATNSYVDGRIGTLNGTSGQASFTGGSINSVISADLALTKVDSPDPVTVGANLTYTLTVTNNGPSTATGVVLTDDIPAPFQSHTTSHGSCSTPAIGTTGTATCNLGSLTSGASAIVTITMIPPTAGGFNNTATVTANEPDFNPANNTATATTTVGVPVFSVIPTSLTFGDQAVGTMSIPQTVTVANTGSSSFSISSATITGANSGDFIKSGIVPVSYSYGTTPPEGTAQGGSLDYFDDTGRQLIDGILGDNLWWADLGNGPAYEWVAWRTVDPLITFNFGAPVTITSVSIGFNRGVGGERLFLPTTVVVGGVSFPVSPPRSPFDLAHYPEEPLAERTRGFLTFTGSWTGSTLDIQLIDGEPANWIGVDEVKFSGSGSSDTCTGATLAPGSLCTVSISFAPTTAAGARNAILAITSNAPGSPHNVPLTGTGVGGVPSDYDNGGRFVVFENFVNPSWIEQASQQHLHAPPPAAGAHANSCDWGEPCDYSQITAPWTYIIKFGFPSSVGRMIWTLFGVDVPTNYSIWFTTDSVVTENSTFNLIGNFTNVSLDIDQTFSPTPPNTTGVKVIVNSTNRGTTTLANPDIGVIQFIPTAEVCVPPPSGLVSWWPGDGNANDIQSLNHGTVAGGVTFVPGKVGQAFNFDGASRVDVADAGNLDITGPITLDAWIKFNGVVSNLPLPNAPIVAKWGSTTYGTGAYGLFVLADGRVWFSLTNQTVTVNVFSPGTLPVGQFAHVAGTWDGSTARLYINGVEVASSPFSGPISANDVSVTIGAYNPAFTNGTGNVVGEIDEVEIYNRALSAAEIQAIFNAGSAGKCKAPQPVSRWLFDEVSGTTASDSVNGNPGTLLNGASFVPGPFGNAVRFDGVDDRVEVPTSPSLEITSQLTLEALVNIEPGNLGQAVAAKWGNTDFGTAGYGLFVFPCSVPDPICPGLSSTTYVPRFIISGDGFSFAQVVSPPISANQWHHLAGTYDGATMSLYVDGVLVASAPLAGGIHNTPAPLVMGNYSPSFTGGASPIKGRIDQVAIYNQALSAATVAQLARSAMNVRAYVTNNGTNELVVVDPTTDTEITRVSVGVFPAEVALAPDGKRAYVANTAPGGGVTVIDTTTNTSAGLLATACAPFSVAVRPDGAFVYVSCPGGAVEVFNANTNAFVTSIPVAGGTWSHIAFSTDGAFAFVTNQSAGTVSVIDTATNVVIENIPVGGGPIGIAVTPDETRAYVTDFSGNQVVVVDLTTTPRTVLGSPVAVGVSPFSVSVTPDGQFAFIVNLADNTVSVIEVATNTVVGLPIAVGGTPTQVAITPDGLEAWVTNQGGTVSVIDVASRTVASTLSGFSTPFGIAIGVVSTAVVSPPSADLAISKTDSPDPVTVGSNLTYTVTVTNNGPSTATGVTVTDTLPANVTFVSATPTQGSCSGTSTITCSLGTLANGANATVTIVVTPAIAGGLSNTATVAANESDPNPGDNSAIAMTTVNPTPAVTTTTQPGSIVGASYSQTLTVTGGTAPFTWSVFSGALPDGLTLSSAGVLSGTPTTAGTFNFTVRVTDTNGAFDDQVLMLTVNPPPLPVSFGPPTNFAVGTEPTSVVVGDFNRDGKLDLVTGNAQSSNVSILIGDGAGSFGAATSFAAGSISHSVAIGDFNRDGKLDLVVANRAGNNVSILLGTGTGSFGPAVNFPVGVNPDSVAIGDFNRDGKLDLAVANAGSNNVSILLGDGAGSFGAATNFAVGTAPIRVAIGDLNGDGKPDLAVANRYSNNVSILLGDGAGSFGAATNFAVGAEPFSVAVGDLNGDGKPDLAVADASSGTMSVLLGTGTGSFGPAAGFPVGWAPVSVAIGDLNGDGKPDLAGTRFNTNEVFILLGDGTGSFGAPTNFAVGTTPVSVAIGDFNGDGKPDLTVANQGGNNVSILLNATMFDPAGSFGPATNFAVGTEPRSVAIGDFNRDGKLDLAVANTASDSVSVLLGTGAGSFGTGTNFGVGNAPFFVAVGDLNRDGKLDLAVANGLSNDVSILLGNGDGTFGAATHFPAGLNPRAVGIGDFNRDGIPDLAVPNGLSDTLSILLGNGDGSFGTATSFAVGDSPNWVAIGNLNRGGKLDLAVANFGSNNVSVLLGDGNGGFAPMAGSPFAVGSQPESVAIGDLNADGIPDLAVANFASTLVSVLLGTGSSFGSATDFTVGSNPQSVTIADLNRDGKLDLAVASQTTDSVAIILGAGSFGPPMTFAVGNAPFSVAIGDLNGDGKPDLAVANQFGNSVSILLNQAPSAAQDTDGDGVPDSIDNCPLTPNADQKDTDGDRIGDVCDIDADNDGVPDKVEIAPGVFAAIPVNAGGDSAALVWNPDQKDTDLDGIPDVLDNCPTVPNPDQLDSDGDGFGDACPPPLVVTGEAAAKTVSGTTTTNTAPVANNDTATVAPNSGNNTINVLNNDTDSNGDTLTVTAVSLAANGTTSFTASGVSYTPGVNFFGTDSFTYTISDGRGGTATGTVTVTVTDGDGVADNVDNCPLVFNPKSTWTDKNGVVHTNEQPDFDLDGIGDACDPDTDGDGFGNATKTPDPSSVYNGTTGAFIRAYSEPLNVGEIRGGDCNDVDRSVNPGATEVLNNNKDDDCNPATKDKQFDIVFDVTSTMVGVAGPVSYNDWLPTDGGTATITARVIDSTGATINNVPVTLTRSLVTKYPGKYTNDASTDVTDDYDVTCGISGLPACASANQVQLISRDYGGKIVFHAEATVTLSDATVLVQNDVSLPMDVNNNDIGDAYERLYPGVTLTRDGDIDTSLKNPYIGDGWTNFMEYRGAKWGPALVKIPVCGNPVVNPCQGRAIDGAQYQSETYVPQGSVVHFRGDPTKKDLFIKFSGYDPLSSPFALGSAFINAGFNVHVRNAAEVNPGETNIRAGVMTNSDTHVNPLTGVKEDGHIYKRTGLRNWAFSTLGYCGVGSAAGPGTPCFSYGTTMGFYISDKPYIDGMTRVPGTKNFTNPPDNKLNLTTDVEDANDNGIKDGGEDGNRNGLLDGDQYVSPVRFDKNLTALDIDTNGYPELPFATDPAAINRGFEYNKFHIFKHVITHEMGHMIGMHHNTVTSCLMNGDTNNFSRDHCFSDDSLAEAFVFNQ